MKPTAALNKVARNLTLAALASLTLGGCYYGDVYGTSYAEADCYSRYGDQYWDNDPFAYDDGYYGYDCYDASDYRSGFVQIGFGGGWHQQLYYPGYGLFLFDRYGRRHAMTHDYLTYWGGRRAWWKHHGHRYRDDGYGRGRNGHHDGRRPGRGYGDSNWRNNPGAVPVPGDRPRGERPRDDRPRDDRPRRDWRDAPGAAPAPALTPNPGAAPPPREHPRREWSGGEGAAPPPRERPRRNWSGGEGAAPPPGVAIDPGAIPQPVIAPGRPRGGDGPGRPRGDGNGREFLAPLVTDSPHSAPPPEPAQPRFSRPPRSDDADRPAERSFTPPPPPAPRATPPSDPEPARFRQPTSDFREGGIKED